MGWYEETKLLLPSLHKCYHCRKRLSNPVIAEWVFLIDGDDFNYYCSEECAIQEKKDRLEKEERDLDLNTRISKG